MIQLMILQTSLKLILREIFWSSYKFWITWWVIMLYVKTAIIEFSFLNCQFCKRERVIRVLLNSPVKNKHIVCVINCI